MTFIKKNVACASITHPSLIPRSAFIQWTKEALEQLGLSQVDLLLTRLTDVNWPMTTSVVWHRKQTLQFATGRIIIGRWCFCTFLRAIGIYGRHSRSVSLLASKSHCDQSESISLPSLASLAALFALLVDWFVYISCIAMTNQAHSPVQEQKLLQSLSYL